MPLFILGLILLIGLLIFSIIRYINSGDVDPRSVRERYPHAFPPKRGAGSGNARNDFSDETSNIRHTEDGNIIFPSDNVENEKAFDVGNGDILSCGSLWRFIQVTGDKSGGDNGGASGLLQLRQPCEIIHFSNKYSLKKENAR